MTVNNRDIKKTRAINIIRNYTKYAPGSVLISYGDTRVLVTASVEDRVPPFLKDSGQGWLTAEYSLLPGSTKPRNRREVTRGKPSGRTNEIQRLIGRSLRGVLNLEALGERTIHIDADVIQADGGTRTAAVTGGMIALWDAVTMLQEEGKLRKSPITELCAAVSVGIVKNEILCDLCYEEDFAADVDMNIVMTESGQFLEVQGTAEGLSFNRKQLDGLLESAQSGINDIIVVLKEELKISVPVS